jgi:hypothetical protein
LPVKYPEMTVFQDELNADDCDQVFSSSNMAFGMEIEDCLVCMDFKGKSKIFSNDEDAISRPTSFTKLQACPQPGVFPASDDEIGISSSISSAASFSSSGSFSPSQVSSVVSSVSVSAAPAPSADIIVSPDDQDVSASSSQPSFCEDGWAEAAAAAVARFRSKLSGAGIVEFVGDSWTGCNDDEDEDEDGARLWRAGSTPRGMHEAPIGLLLQATGDLELLWPGLVTADGAAAAGGSAML